MNFVETYDRLREAIQAVTSLRFHDRTMADFATAVDAARSAVADLAEYAKTNDDSDLATAAWRLGQIIDEMAR